MEPYKIKNIAGHLAKAFLSNPLTPILAIAILLLGWISLEIMPREEDPQIQVSGGSVIVAIPGATPREITNVIIKPLERRIREIKGIDNIYGTAMNNFGMVNVQYLIGQDRESSNLKLYDKVMQNMDQLPKGTMPPLVKPFDIDIDIPILTVAFYKLEGAQTDTIKLYKTIRELQQDINALDNVSKTTLKGVKRPQFNVMVDLHKLSGYHISLGQVAQSIKAISSNAPEIDTPTSTGKIVVFGVENAIDSISDLEELIIAQYHGSPIYLKNIATVDYSYDIQNYQSTLITYHQGMDSDEAHHQEHKDDQVEDEALHFRDAGDQITMTVSKLKGTNAVLIAESAIEELQKAKQELRERGVGFIVTRNYGVRANEAVNELVHHLLITIFIIALILIPFLGWRESLVVTIAVPMILATTLFIALMTDQTINRITLFAFLLSLGLIVDDAIIVIENIHRRLHLPESEGLEFDEIIIQATDEIGPSTNIATIAIMLTMIPMAFVGGMMGQFMKPIPLNVPVALAVSLFVAYVFAPYLARKFIKFKKGGH
ncbi:MAG: efflux RND transporter permease subunit [Campylobacterota bacterium]|nr:efflux RND transporter permease subunit [Campylobacterota bacterium]